MLVTDPHFWLFVCTSLFALSAIGLLLAALLPAGPGLMGFLHDVGMNIGSGGVVGGAGAAAGAAGAGAAGGDGDSGPGSSGSGDDDGGSSNWPENWWWWVWDQLTRDKIAEQQGSGTPPP